MALTESGNLTQLSDTGYSRDDLVNFFAGLGRQFDVSVESGDVDALAAKLMGESGCIRQIGGNPQRCFDQFTEQYRRRGGADTTPGVEGTGGVDSSTLSAGSLRVEQPIARPIVGGQTYETFQQNGETAFRFYTPPPPPVASMVVGDMGVTADAPPTVGPVGLAVPTAPINYATGASGPEYGYGFGGTPEGTSFVSSSTASGNRSMTMFLLLAAAAVAAVLLLGKKKK